MKSRKRVRAAGSGLIKQIRKPIAPPSRIEPDRKGYDRSRQRENERRELEEIEQRNRSDGIRKS